MLERLYRLTTRRNKMSKYDDMKPSKPFEPTPWLIVVLILMCIVLVSVVDNCGMAS